MADENEDRGGVIVNIASTAGFEFPLPGAAAYAASKAGVVGFTRECAREYAGYNIRVRALLPGTAESPTTVAQAVLHLCSNAGEVPGSDLQIIT